MKRSRRESVGKNEEEAEYCSISRLPEACLAHAISLTTPMDACRCSAVSAAFQTAASSDAVWDRFLPPGYHSVLALADDPVDFTTSKKELFLTLAQDHVLLDQRSKSFWLEIRSGVKCYMLSSRSLQITWEDNPLYWRRIYLPDSRFEEVAELMAVCWFDLTGSVNCKELSPNTEYAAYLVFKLTDESYGLDSRTQEASITMDDQVVSAKRTVSLHPRTQETPHLDMGTHLDSGRSEEEGRAEEIVSYPRERGDGWMEVQLGQFYSHQGDTGVAVIHLQEHVQLNWKKGLILEGMEIRHNIAP